MLRKDNSPAVISPWQIADECFIRLNWPRPDLNVACIELLVGLVFLCDPPTDVDDWEERQKSDPERLRERMTTYASAFELLGDGPRFMQDLEPLQGEPTLPDMLFVDSAGQQTAKKNADLMVRRKRYQRLSQNLAAMAIYTLQAHAPAGGAGNRTSMRGGGPMVTLVNPREGRGLWSVVWANTPYGHADSVETLPWMRPTQSSESRGSERWPIQGRPVEAFFGMPRRLRLVEEDGQITGVIQKRYGNNYSGWVHPLTPYYRIKEGSELLPKHPRPGRFGYRNWLGVVADDNSNSLTQMAETAQNWKERTMGAPADLIVSGWAMDNMKPLDFTWSSPPLVRLEDDEVLLLRGLIEAAESFGMALRFALAPVLAKGETREAVREQFFSETQVHFENSLNSMGKGTDPESISKEWVQRMKEAALSLFESEAIPGLADREASDQKRVVDAHQRLSLTFRGFGTHGAKAFGALGITPESADPKERTT